MNKRCHYGAALSACVLSACATNAVTPAQRTHFDAQLSRLSARPTALVADGCVVRDEVGTDFVLRNPSDAAGRAVATSAEDFLRARGIGPQRTVVPFICGQYEGTEPSFLMADHASAKPAPQPLPLPIEAATQQNPALAAAYRSLLRAVADAPQLPDKGGQMSTVLPLNAAERHVLRGALGADDVWIVSGSGVQVSAGKSIGTGVLTGVLAAALTGGMFVSSTMSVSGYGYMIALVDLRDGSMHWKKQQNAIQGEPTNVAVFNADWANKAFEPLVPATLVAVTAPSPGTAAAAPIALAPAPAPGLALAAPVAPAGNPGASAAVPASLAVEAPPPATAAATQAFAPPAVRVHDRIALVGGASLRSAPTPQSAIWKQIAAGTVVTIDARIDNATGTWLYLTAASERGWIPESELALPGVARAD